MAYDYAKQRPGIFTEEGVKMLTLIRDTAREHISKSGAVMADRLMAKCSGDSWAMLACIDYLVEQGELREVPRPGAWAQNRVFVGRDDR